MPGSVKYLILNIFPGYISGIVPGALAQLLATPVITFEGLLRPGGARQWCSCKLCAFSACDRSFYTPIPPH